MTTPPAQGVSAHVFLSRVGEFFAGLPDVEFEFSVRLELGLVASHGRFTCWVTGASPQALAPVAEALAALDAPSAVREAQAAEDRLPVAQGIGFAHGSAGPEMRFYRHSRDRETLADRYDAWRWGPGGEVRTSTYRFSYLPETPDGLRPESLIAPELQPAFALLLAGSRVQALAGFWLREEDGRLLQLDLSLPWRPAAISLAGVTAVAEYLGIPATEPTLQLHIKHIAFRLGETEPAITLYASAPATNRWPVSETELQAIVASGSRAFHQAIEAEVFAHAPSTYPTAAASTPGPELDRFYGGPIPQWKAILGDEMHYHAGLFSDPNQDPDDVEAQEAMRSAIRELYPLLPAGGAVYDIGCGWGGPLSMLARELHCPVTGLTISRTQYRYVASLGYRIRLGDAEQTLPPGAFHAALLIESLCHCRDKYRLLRALRPFCARIVMRVNCQDASPPAPAFGGSMHMIASTELRRLIEAAGWRIRHWRDRRAEALPSVRYWRRRLDALGFTGDPHAEVLRRWTGRVLESPEKWAANNPLIEVMAD
jgi:hypothetical protein